jgi:hypothetical protein
MEFWERFESTKGKSQLWRGPLGQFFWKNELGELVLCGLEHLKLPPYACMARYLISDQKYHKKLHIDS